MTARRDMNNFIEKELKYEILVSSFTPSVPFISVTELKPCAGGKSPSLMRTSLGYRSFRAKLDSSPEQQAHKTLGS